MLGYMTPNQYALSATGDSAPGIKKNCGLMTKTAQEPKLLCHETGTREWFV